MQEPLSSSSDTPTTTPDTPLTTATVSTAVGENTPEVAATSSSEVTTPVTTDTPAAAAPVAVAAAATAMTTPSQKLFAKLPKQTLKQYGIAFGIVILMGGALVYMLEEQGRLDTKIFSTLKGWVVPAPAAVLVNGEKIPLSIYEKNRDQFLATAAQQGLDPATPAVQDQVKEQALEVIINTEVLAQAAVAAGIVVTEEQTDTRYNEIMELQGGEEQLKSRMAELGISEEDLARDIRQEILIQTHLETAVDLTGIEVTEEEIKTLYDSLGGGEVELPPLTEIRAQIEQELRFGKEQDRIAAYIKTLREKAEIEILI
jgi:parvulin-like peptidyl-prolyl isomerase